MENPDFSQTLKKIVIQFFFRLVELTNPLIKMLEWNEISFIQICQEEIIKNGNLGGTILDNKISGTNGKVSVHWISWYDILCYYRGII